ncbi:MAG: Phage Tail Collar Domain protein [Gemmatimonadetes bacterium]|nr:Phage Tail Collar Domain protein [Gemmatimonadota bacterium]
MSDNNGGSGKRKIMTITPAELLHPMTRRELLRRAALSGSVLLLSGMGTACRDFDTSPTEPSAPPDATPKPQSQSTMTANPVMGELIIFSFNFAPRGWAMCNGQFLPINQNQALFSLLGTNFGGNGQTTFALPDLRSRVPIHVGQGPGLGNYTMGQKAGTEAHTVTQQQLPTHTHQFMASAAGANTPVALNTVLGSGNNLYVPDIITDPDNERARELATTKPAMYSSGTVLTTLSSSTIGASGGNQPHENRQPFLVLNICIAVQGTFPA